MVLLSMYDAYRLQIKNIQIYITIMTDNLSSLSFSTISRDITITIS
nr:MAG TPA: hypothetical protein [Bacteriophage sp.]